MYVFIIIPCSHTYTHTRNKSPQWSPRNNGPKSFTYLNKVPSFMDCSRGHWKGETPGQEDSNS